MLAVHFGAGNIGRGFIGSLLNRSGYEVCFIDVNTPLVEEIRERRAYTVCLLGEEVKRIDVNNVTALNSRTEPEGVIEAIAEADVVTTAVGASVLKAVAPILAEGLRLRLRKGGGYLNVVACENMLGGSSLLKTFVTDGLREEERQEIDSLVGFPDAAVDRIVPDQTGNDLLEVTVEPFYEWIVDQSRIKGPVPSIEGITYVDDLQPYIERKLFTVNTGHAICAYLGYVQGHGTVLESIADATVRKTVSGALEETGKLLVQKHGFDPGNHRKYMESILERFENPHLTDPVTRVARSPIRKLGRKDRLLGPALQMADYGIEPNHLAIGIAAALRYDDPGDMEAADLQRLIELDGPAGALQEIGDIPLEHPLIQRVLDRYQELQAGEIAAGTD